MHKKNGQIDVASTGTERNTCGCTNMVLYFGQKKEIVSGIVVLQGWLQSEITRNTVLSREKNLKSEAMQSLQTVFFTKPTRIEGEKEIAYHAGTHSFRKSWEEPRSWTFPVFYYLEAFMLTKTLPQNIQIHFTLDLQV